MKEIRNKTSQPIQIPLPGGKKLFLGPNKLAQITDKALAQPSVQRLVEEESIEILGEGERTDAVAGPGGTPGQIHDRGKSPFRRRQGER